jgi:hypothetical protein
MRYVIEALSELVRIPNPPPNAPAELEAGASTAIGLVKWGSLIAVGLTLAGIGGTLFAAEHGHGSGISPQMKSRLGSVVLVLIIVAAGASIVDFFQ